MNLAQQIAEHYFELYLHDNRNFIIHDVFSEYKEMVKEVFEGLVINYRTAKVGLSSFNDFFIREAIIHVNSEDLKKMLQDCKELKIEESGLQKLLFQFETYLKSFYKESSMAFDPFPSDLMTEFLLNRDLEKKLQRIFSNFFIILSKSELADNAMSSIERPLLNFLRTEDFLNWTNIEALANFVKIKGNILSAKTLQRILEIAIEYDKPDYNKYERLVYDCSRSIHQFHPELKISNPGLISKAIANCHSMSNGVINFRSYIFLLNVVDESGKQRLITAIDQSLENDFSPVIYEDLLRYKFYDYQYRDYFNQYITLLSPYCGGGITFVKQEVEHSNFVFLNMALLLHNLDIKLTTEQKNLFTSLTKFDEWLLDPTVYNYDEFELYWLKAVMHHKNLMKKLAVIEPIRSALEYKLNHEFVQEYSDTYGKYFVGGQKNFSITSQN